MASTSSSLSLSQPTENHSIERLTPDEYARAVKDFSRLPMGSSYLVLGKFLDDDRKSQTILQMDGSKDVALVYSLPLGTEGQGGQRAQMQLTTDCLAFQNPTQLGEVPSNTSCLIFFRGFLSAEWIRTIGSQFCIDFKFFGRHLDFRSAQDKSNNFSTPSLPSASWHLMELPLTTIGIRDSPHHGMTQLDWILKEDKRVREALEKHHDRLSSLSSDIGVGETMIRDYYVFDDIHFAIDQRISIWMQQAEDGKSEDERQLFRILVWADPGTDTRHGKHEPWDTESNKLKYHPVIDNKPMTALKGDFTRHSATIDKGSSTPLDSLSQLYQNYGRSLRPEIKAVDPFYALGEIFQFSANSQQQFLNMIEAKLRIYIAKGPGHEEILSHLKYTQQILFFRISDIKRVLMSIENARHPSWMKSNIEAEIKKAEIAYNAIQRDFEHLLNHAEALYDRTKEAISVLQSSISIKESIKASKLAFLAYIFVPTSVASGILGMNVKEFSGDQISIIWFLILSFTGVIMIVFFLFFEVIWKKIKAKWLSEA